MTQAIGIFHFPRYERGSLVKNLWKSYPGAMKGKALLPEEIQKMVGGVVSSISHAKEISLALDFLTKAFPRKSIEEAISLNVPDYPGIQAAMKHFSERFSHPILKKRSSFRCSFHSFFVALESFLKSLGLIDLFKPVVGVYDEETKSQKMILLSTLFSTLATTAIPLMGPIPGGLAVGGFFSLLIALSFLYPLWKPLPNYLPKIENWTEKYGMGILESGDIRKQLLDQIVESLKSSQYDHSQVMLVGKPGVGKTELVKTLVQAIANGDYPEFKGYQVFYINAADLMSCTDWVPKTQSILSFFSDAFGRYRNQIIFVIDQMQIIASNENSAYLPEQLHGMFDRSKESFPHVIGIATESGFRELEKTQAGFSERFHCIPIQPMNNDETLHILRYTILKISPEIFVDEDTLRLLLKKIREKFGDQAVMPKFALRILSKCIQRASKDQKTNLEIEVRQLRKRLEMLRLEKQGIYFKDPSFGSKDSLIEGLQKELLEKEKKLASEKKQAALFFERRDLLLEMRRKVYDLALKISSFSSEKEIKSFLLLSYFMIPSLEKELEKEALLLGLHLGIDASLIDEVIQSTSLLR